MHKGTYFFLQIRRHLFLQIRRHAFFIIRKMEIVGKKCFTTANFRGVRQTIFSSELYHFHQLQDNDSSRVIEQWQRLKSFCDLLFVLSVALRPEMFSRSEINSELIFLFHARGFCIFDYKYLIKIRYGSYANKNEKKGTKT